MASLQQFPSGNFHITFQFGGKRFKRALKTKDETASNFFAGEARRDNSFNRTWTDRPP